MMKGIHIIRISMDDNAGAYSHEIRTLWVELFQALAVYFEYIVNIALFNDRSCGSRFYIWSTMHPRLRLPSMGICELYRVLPPAKLVTIVCWDHLLITNLCSKYNPFCWKSFQFNSWDSRSNAGGLKSGEVLSERFILAVGKYDLLTFIMTSSVQPLVSSSLIHFIIVLFWTRSYVSS